jgi:hypothetical protein
MGDERRWLRRITRTEPPVVCIHPVMVSQPSPSGGALGEFVTQQEDLLAMQIPSLSSPESRRPSPCRGSLTFLILVIETGWKGRRVGFPARSNPYHRVSHRILLGYYSLHIEP